MADFLKFSVFLFLALLSAVSANGQASADKKYAVSTVTSTYGLSSYTLTDPYLSPLPYSGIGLRMEEQHRKFFKPENTHLSQQLKSNLLFGMGLNPTHTASELYMGGTLNYGIHYHFRPFSNLQLLAGGAANLALGVKYIARNVNNPANIDVATNLNFSGMALYNLHVFKKTLKFELAVQSPLFGGMFVPLQGASYYEMFGLGNLRGTTHFSALHNKRGLDCGVGINVPFSSSVWRFAINYNYLKYSANNLVFKQKELSFSIGGTFDFIRFAGTKNKAPANFISVEN